MEKSLLKTLLNIEIKEAVKKGVDVETAAKTAADKLIKDMQMAEFETYCNEHNC